MVTRRTGKSAQWTDSTGIPGAAAAARPVARHPALIIAALTHQQKDTT
jgi:hypothetical protein